MTELFGFPAPENHAEYCELCNDRNEEGCPCESYYKASKEDQAEMDKVIYGED